MAEAKVQVRFAGPHVSFQDGGRPGWARFGVPQSGAMDRLALAAANIALGNPPEAPVIEVSRGGLQLECSSGEIGFALAGGGFILDHARRRGGSWQRGVLKAGESLTIRPGPWGNWTCLAFAGQPDLTSWLGSLATHGPSGLGGGRLTTGTTLRFIDSRQDAGLPRDIPCPVFARPTRVLRATPGPQDRYFDADRVATFYDAIWQVTAAADRMGTRLAGPDIAPRRPLDMASEPLARGSVQVAGDGVATVLTADHQTTGGYPRIATVLDCDLDAFAQLSQGQRFVFQPVSAGTAIRLARTRRNATERYLATLAHHATD